MSDLAFARTFITLVNVFLALVCANVYLQREIERTEGPEVRAEEDAYVPAPESQNRYYKPCLSCATTVFDAAGNVIDTLPPTE